MPRGTKLGLMRLEPSRNPTRPIPILVSEAGLTCSQGNQKLSNLLGSSTLGTAGHLLRHKILATSGSLQQQRAGEPYTPYQILPHHSWLNRRGHRPKKTREQSTPSLFLITINVGRQDFMTHLLVLPPSPTWDGLKHLVTPSVAFSTG
jgi:hypothetical protein